MSKDGGTTRRLSGATRRWLPLVILVSAAFAAYVAGLHHYISLEKIAENRDYLVNYVDQHLALALLIFAAIYILAVALSLPGGLALTIIGGFLFGWLLGGTVTVLAATIGSMLVFEIVRTSLGEALAKRAGPWLGKLSAGFDKNAVSYMLFLRLVPVFPFWLINIAPALLNVKRSVYFFTTLVGIIPATYAFSLLGAGLDSIIVKQRDAYRACVAKSGPDACVFSIDPKSLVTKELLFAFAALAVVALIPILVKKFKKQPAL